MEKIQVEIIKSGDLSWQIVLVCPQEIGEIPVSTQLIEKKLSVLQSEENENMLIRHDTSVLEYPTATAKVAQNTNSKSVSNNIIDLDIVEKNTQLPQIKQSKPKRSRMLVKTKVFISYSHDSVEHKNYVKLLSEKLIELGLDCVIDQYTETEPPTSWSKWMRKQIEEAKFVLIICTEKYKERTDGHLGAVSWEGAIIEESCYSKYQNNKFIPIFVHSKDENYKPVFLGSNSYVIDIINLEKTEFIKKYELLYRQLTEQPSVLKPKLGKIVKLPPK